MISGRERTLLSKLLESREYIPVKQLASSLGTSERTIHRELNRVDSTLLKFGMKLERKAGVGVQILGSVEQQKKLLHDIYRESPVEYSQPERCRLLLCMLVKSDEPIKLYTLASSVQATVAKVRQDLERIEVLIQSYSLQLLRRRGEGISLEGTEQSKRDLLQKLALDSLSEEDMIHVIEQGIHGKQRKRADLFGIVDEHIFNQVEEVVSPLLEALPYPLADSAYFGLLVHLSVTIERLQNQETISMEEETLQSLQPTPEYKSASEFVEYLGEAFSIEIPQEEKGYVTLHLRSARRLREDHTLDALAGSALSFKVQQFIERVAKKLNVSLADNYSLYQGLLAHMEPAIFRVQNGVSGYNPLKQKILDDYPSIVHAVEHGLKEEFPGTKFPMDEVAFLVMHFGSVLEGKKDKLHIRALVVCSSGIGSSKMLGSRIQKELPEFRSLELCSLLEMRKKDLSSYDVILATITLPIEASCYVQVSPLLPEGDIRKIRNFVQEHLEEIMHRSSVSMNHKDKKVNVGNTIEWLTILQQYGNVVKSILQNFSCTVTNEVSIESILKQHLQTNMEKLIVSPREVVQKLVEREKSGGLGIPQTKMALYHTRHEAVKTPFVHFIRLQTPVVVKGMDGKQMDIQTIVLMLAPISLSTEGAEVLSLVSSTLIESEEMIWFFEHASERELLQKLNAVCQQWITKKITHQE